MNREPQLKVSPLDKVYITQFFGENPSVYSQFGMKGHNGVDFRVKFVDSPLGKRYVTPLYKGRVINAEYDNGYGWYVRVQHRGSSQTVYGHNTKLYVKVGDEVDPSTRIALSGNTGFSSGAHVHLGLRPEGWQQNYNNGYYGYVDPMPYLEGLKTLDPDAQVPLLDWAFAEDWAGWLVVVPKLKGELWHVHPKTLLRTYLGKVEPAAGERLARSQKTRDGLKVYDGWVGMTPENLARLPMA